MNRVFLNGIWKSGNNLIIKVCEEMGCKHTDFGLASSLVVGKHYLVRSFIRGPKFQKRSVSIGIDMPINVSESWLDKKLQNKDMVSFGGHCAYSTHLLSMLKKNRIKPIFIIRDPRDVIVSFAHWISTRPDYYPHRYFKNLSLKEKMKAVIIGIDCGEFYLDGFPVVMDRVYGWLNQPEDVLVIRFEDLVGSKGGGSDEAQMISINAIAKWVGMGSTQNSIEDVSKKVFGDTPTFRKGLIGEWQKEFDDELKLLFQKKIGARLDAWGYK